RKADLFEGYAVIFLLYDQQLASARSFAKGRTYCSSNRHHCLLDLLHEVYLELGVVRTSLTSATSGRSQQSGWGFLNPGSQASSSKISNFTCTIRQQR